MLLAFFAGLLTTLSPCVLPLLPLVVGSASSRHRLGPVALCVGLILSFSVVAVAVALVTQAFNFDPGIIRMAAGPTLGAAIGLATQARTALHGFVLMLAFGMGTSVPLLAVAYSSRSLFQAKRRWLIALSGKAKPVFGVILIFVAVGIMSGWDKKLEALVLRYLPESWIDLTTRY